MAEVTETPSWRKAVAELIGTFMLIYIGVLVLVVPEPRNLVGVGLAHGIALGVMISATMMISGGQLNPAITVGLLAVKRISPAQAAYNIVGQLVGGIAAGYLAWASLGWAKFGGFPVIVPGVPDLGAGVSIGTGILIETILTFFLMFVVMGTAVDNRFGARLGGMAIGLTIAADIMAAGPLTGAAMNPARWIGAAIPASHTANALVYIIGPILGAVLAALVYQHVLMDDAQKA
ncbi:MAG: aquaporin [Candidatus Thermoplasmatota archaeon]